MKVCSRFDVVLSAVFVLALASGPAVQADQSEDNRPQGRVTGGLQVLYDFRETKGAWIKDRAGSGRPLNLKIQKVDHVRRTEGALRITGNNRIQTEGPVSRINEAIRKSGALTVEAWVRPIGLNQKGPARIVTISKNAVERNITLGQEGDQIEVRLRTTKTSTNGLPGIRSNERSVAEKVTHVAYTFDRRGQAILYLNGKRAAQKKLPGALSNWKNDFRLGLGDEITGDRGWRGEYYLVAMYSRSLSPEEVNRNFQAGRKGQRSVEPENLAAQRAHFFEAEIAPILSRHCLECHDSASREGGLDLSRKASAAAGGESGKVFVAGKADESLLWETVRDDVMPQDRPPLSEDEKNALKKWINDGAQWSVDYVDPAIYRSVRTSDLWVQRLTLPEYVASVRTAVGVDIAEEARQWLPRDKRADGFRNTAYNLNVDLKHVESYARLAEAIVEKMDTVAFAERFSKSRKLTDDNMRALIAEMGKWVLRGPLEEHEVVTFRGISTTVASAGGSFREAVGFVLEAMLQSPKFLYRIEGQVGDGTWWPVGQFELASRISYILWGAPPDEELFAAAESGQLANSDQIRQHVERMLQDPRAVERSKQFVIQWLNLDRLDNMQPSQEKFPDWKNELAEDMRRETIEFFLDLVWEQRRPLGDLLNAQFTYSTPRLAKHYGIETKGDGLQRYDLSKVASRGGLLTHGSVLTIGGDDASMVTRGLFVLNDLLFSEVGDPPPGLDTTPVPTSPGRTHRAIAMERVESTACGGCHSRFEPLAFGLEKFDGLGAFHEVDEHGNRLREDGEILFPGDADPIQYASSAEMMDLLAKSERVSQCLTRKVTQFALGRPLYAADAAALRSIHAAAEKGGGTYQSTITAIVLSDLVRMTQTEPAERVAKAN